MKAETSPDHWRSPDVAFPLEQIGKVGEFRQVQPGNCNGFAEFCDALSPG